MAEKAKSLIIVESPSKAKTINKYLGKDFVVEASFGHIKNLPKSKLGVDVESDYEPTYETIQSKVDVVRKLKERAKKAKDVYLATDPDREGEAIAWHIAEELESVNGNIYRVLFHEITRSGIDEAMSNRHKIDDNLVYSQQARRIMDRIVGYQVSPFVWKTVYYGLSAGRVQTVALRLICERAEEIERFVPVEYWSVIGQFKTDKTKEFYAKLIRIDGKQRTIGSEDEVRRYLDEIKTQTYAVANVQKKDVKRNPPAPFITSTLQQEAASRLRFSTKKTMMLAQRLYEGIELGEEGSVGLITYMRTDSVRLSAEAVAGARDYIYSNYGKEYVPKEPRQYKKSKSSQDAHEAIRPTSTDLEPKKIKKHLERDLFRLYELIWNRFIASQMQPAVYEQVNVEIEGGRFMFRASGSSIRFRGFLQAYDDTSANGTEDKDADPVSPVPTELAVGQSATLLDLLPKQHFTKPPPAFTEASLVRELESLGIGRPSTYSLIISTILERKYVEQKDRQIHPTELGREVYKLLTQHFPDIFNVKFTAQMEDELDTIASGKQSYKKVLDDFYHPFTESLERVNKKTSEIKKSLQENAGEDCDLCGRPMIIKWGRNGRFMACSGYPTCKNTKPLAHEQERLEKAVNNAKCELCGADMAVKGGPFGPFLGCSRYPECKNTKPITLGIKCPKCNEGEVLERKTKRKRTFYGCSKYPKCDFASWDKPVMQPCPGCDNPFIVEKYTQKKGQFYKCPQCKSEYDPEEMEIAGKATGS
jgi:DNA topoisomerase I